MTPSPQKMHAHYKEKTKVTLRMRSLTAITLNEQNEVVSCEPNINCMSSESMQEEELTPYHSCDVLVLLA